MLNHKEIRGESHARNMRNNKNNLNNALNKNVFRGGNKAPASTISAALAHAPLSPPLSNHASSPQPFSVSSSFNRNYYYYYYYCYYYCCYYYYYYYRISSFFIRFTSDEQINIRLIACYEEHERSIEIVVVLAVVVVVVKNTKILPIVRRIPVTRLKFRRMKIIF